MRLQGPIRTGALGALLVRPAPQEIIRRAQHHQQRMEMTAVIRGWITEASVNGRGSHRFQYVQRHQRMVSAEAAQLAYRGRQAGGRNQDLCCNWMH